MNKPGLFSSARSDGCIGSFVHKLFINVFDVNHLLGRLRKRRLITMAIKTKIEWTESTWNPVTGCIKQWGGRNKKQAGRLLMGRTWDAMPAIGLLGS